MEKPKSPKNAEDGRFTSKVILCVYKFDEQAIGPQKQSSPGRWIQFSWGQKNTHSSEQQLLPKSESTRLEGSDRTVEYRGADKLVGKSAIISGGE